LTQRWGGEVSFLCRAKGFFNNTILKLEDLQWDSALSLGIGGFCHEFYPTLLEHSGSEGSQNTASEASGSGDSWKTIASGSGNRVELRVVKKQQVMLPVVEGIRNNYQWKCGSR